MKACHRSLLSRRIRAVGLATLAALLGFPVMAPTQAKAEEIIVTITRVRALDKIDALSKADFGARVTIAGEAFPTAVIQNDDDIRPRWTLRKKVAAGVHDVKIELLDKDVTKSDLIDINRIAGKRDLDFKVDTGKCTVGGFTSPYRCGTAIVRSGDERKRALIMFSVAVKR